MSTPPTTRTSQVWKRHAPIGKFAMVQGMGGIVAPLLAGFSLATIALLLTTGWVNSSTTSKDGPPFADWAVAALAVAATLFVLTMEFAFIAARHAITPEERLAWTPEAAVNEDVLQNARIEQALDRRLADFYSNRARFLYNLAIAFLLAGLLMLLIPRHWTPPLVVGAIVVGLALIFEVWSTQAPLLHRLYAAIFPEYDDVREEVTRTVSSLDPVSRDSIMRSRREEGPTRTVPDHRGTNR